MRLFEENEKLIVEIEEQINKLKISELEQKIKAKEIENLSCGENIYEGYNQVVRIKNRIYAVNEKIVNEQDALRNRMNYVDNMYKMPCGIEYMDMPLNNGKYIVITFYQELYEKYKEEPMRLILLGMTPILNGRVIRLERLDESDKKKALILDEYLKLCSIREQFEALIDCVKNIQYNYI